MPAQLIPIILYYKCLFYFLSAQTWNIERVKKMEENYAAKMIREKAIDPTPTQIIKIEGVGTAIQYGELDVEKLVKRLLESKAITGEH